MTNDKPDRLDLDDAKIHRKVFQEWRPEDCFTPSDAKGVVEQFDRLIAEVERLRYKARPTTVELYKAVSQLFPQDQKKIDSLTTELERLRFELSIAQNLSQFKFRGEEDKEIRKQITSLTTELEQCRKERDEFKNTAKVMSIRFNEAQAENAELNEALLEMDTTSINMIAKLEKERDEWESKANHECTRNDKLQVENARLKKYYKREENLEKENSGLKAKLANAEERVEELHQQIRNGDVDGKGEHRI